jgi:hypothetical protein
MAGQMKLSVISIKWRTIILLLLIMVNIFKLEAQFYINANIGSVYRFPSYAKNRPYYQSAVKSTVRPSIMYHLLLGYESGRHRFDIGYSELYLRTFEDFTYYGWDSLTPSPKPVYRYRALSKLNTITFGYGYMLKANKNEIWLKSEFNWGIDNGILQPPPDALAYPIDNKVAKVPLEFKRRQYLSFSAGVEVNRNLFNNRFRGFLYSHINYQLPKIYSEGDVNSYGRRHMDYNLFYIQGGMGIRYFLGRKKQIGNTGKK